MAMDTNSTSYLRFKTFQIMWLVFILFHMAISSPVWSTIGNEFLNPSNHFFLAINFLIVILVLISLINPDRLLYSLLTIIFLTVVKLDALPTVPNHIILTLIVHFTILLSLLLYWDRSLELQDRIAKWFDKTAPYLRIELLIMYFFVVFHKLNYDYFNPAVSCSVELYTDITSILPFLPTQSWINLIMIGMILLTELAIPVLLMIPRTRVLGVFVGLVFHFLLSIHPNLYILSFSAELYALYVLFLPDEIIIRISERVKTKVEQINVKRTLPILSGVFILGIGAYLSLRILQGDITIASLKNNLGNLFLNGVHITWIVFCLFLIARSAIIFRDLFLQGRPYSSSYFRISRSPLLLLPFLALLNGISPYIGLKTATNFSMYSNLHVNGSDNNHLFMPSSFQVSDLQDDTVTLLSTNSPYLQGFIERNERITYFELSRFLLENQSKDMQVTFRRNGNKQTIDLNKQQATSFLESSWIARKLLAFRGVPKTGPTPCQW